MNSYQLKDRYNQAYIYFYLIPPSLSLFLLLTVLSFAEIVYITPTGKKYHATKTCKGLVRAKKIIPIERKEAEAKGYKPCKHSYGG